MEDKKIAKNLQKRDVTKAAQEHRIAGNDFERPENTKAKALHANKVQP